MTTYAAAFTASSPKITIAPSSTYQVRIARIEVCTPNIGAGGNITYTVSVYPSNTPTGGTALSPLAMRSGAPATTVAAKSGATISGTGTLLHTEATSVPNVTGNETGTFNSNYAFPFDLIISSGGTLVLASTSGYSTSLVVYYEELRLAWTS